MALLDQEPPPPGNRTRLIGVGVAVGAAAALAFGVVWLTSDAPEDTADSAASASPTPAPTDAAPPEPAPVPAPPPAPEPTPPPRPTVERVAEPAVPSPPPTVLRVTSDVDGADVFVDREYVGTTPFESSAITTGRHRINVSAEGYEGFATDVEIGDTPTEIAVAFREVTLDARVEVVHKHRFGSCTGQLIARIDGIRYETSDDDAFMVALGDLEEFSVDYLEHTLRITPRDGRTYNFTDERENADALFVFHRDVERARERIARGDRPSGP